MLNEEHVVKLIRRHLNSRGELSWLDFSEMFYSLNKSEQYEVIRIMIKHDIDFEDDEDDEIKKCPGNASIMTLDAGDDVSYSLIRLTNEQLCLM